MRLKTFCAFLAAAFVCTLNLAAAAPDLAIIAKARAFVGPEARLQSIRTIHFTGRLTAADGTKAAVDIMFEKPCRQRVVATSDTRIEITALDDYDAWQKISDPNAPLKRSLLILGKDQILRLRANTFENLYFFRGVTDPSQIEDLGKVQVDGKAAVKLLFRYAPDIYFIRYFDASSGRLLRTETAFGDVIVEEGEILVDGVRFAKRIITTSPRADGGSEKVVVEFDKVTLNEEMPDSLFTVPMPTAY